MDGRGAGGAAVGLSVGSMALALIVVGAGRLGQPARLWTAEESTFLACAGGYALPLVLLLAERQDDLRISEPPASRP